MINYPSDIKKFSLTELNQLADEIRQFIIDHISNTGGHLASNLGVVELTIALHWTFNSPIDKIIWDVGHQSYVHKILTGRKDIFPTMRQFEGISGFPRIDESVHDIFGTGHSSTSISAALGIARARDLKNEVFDVIPIIGDGALTSGMAFEALNDVGSSNTKITVILNDNEMSISKNVGAMSKHLTNIRSSRRYKWLKRGFDTILKKTPVIGNVLGHGMERLKNSLKYIIVPGIIFEEMGLTYIGPVDGHNIGLLLDTFKSASKIEGPTIIHIITTKGKGYEYAERTPESYHGISSFNIRTGMPIENENTSYSNIFGTKLRELAREDDSIVAISAAMPEGTGLLEFQEEFKDRFFDVGIAEQHAVTMAAGLAINGIKPYVAIYSSFLQRAYDQIIHDVCIQNLPVVFCIDRAGLVGEDGETHQGVFDLSYLRPMPNMTIMSPKDSQEFKLMLEYAREYNGPIAIRYPKGFENSLPGNIKIDLPYWESLVEGHDLVILAVGRMVKTALEIENSLSNMGLNIGIVNARVIKPLDERFLLEISKRYRTWVTLEDNMIAGGFGSSINEFISDRGIDIKIKNYGIPDIFVTHGDIDILYKELGLDAASLTKNIKNMIKSK
ncbi:MAG: 1-deoxy-D-xylulose-5-phosphate synthase [Clostridiales bacterium]|nr:1-deoxy-D-xylulose-5-phosphate synthase [Clostridiales bacterium]